MSVIFDTNPDTALREFVRMREKARLDAASALHEAREEGRKKGREEGRKEGREEGRQAIIDLMRECGIDEVTIEYILKNAIKRNE